MAKELTTLQKQALAQAAETLTNYRDVDGSVSISFAKLEALYPILEKAALYIISLPDQPQNESTKMSYKFKCPHCGSTEGVSIRRTGTFKGSATRFDEYGDPVDAEEWFDCEDIELCCDKCGEFVYRIEDNLVEAED